MAKIKEIIPLWREDKKKYVKKSTISAYSLMIENHILPHFGSKTYVDENEVQEFVFQKLNNGLSHKSVKDILIVLKMIQKFGIKNKMLEYSQIDIKFPTERERCDIDKFHSFHLCFSTNVPARIHQF